MLKLQNTCQHLVKQASRLQSERLCAEALGYMALYLVGICTAVRLESEALSTDASSPTLPTRRLHGRNHAPTSCRSIDGSLKRSSIFIITLRHTLWPTPLRRRSTPAQGRQVTHTRTHFPLHLQPHLRTMGGGNAQKSATARARNLEKAKKAAGGGEREETEALSVHQPRFMGHVHDVHGEVPRRVHACPAMAVPLPCNQLTRACKRDRMHAHYKWHTGVLHLRTMLSFIPSCRDRC